MSFLTIMFYYAIICLVMIPFSVLGILYLYKKTDVMEKFEARLDKILDEKENKKKPKESQGQPAPSQAQTKPEPPAQASPETEEEPSQKYPIARFRLGIGDIYFCRLGSNDQGGRSQKLLWTVENDFIGEIQNGDVFKALKTGKVVVSCAREDNDFDAGSRVYEIDVTPSNENWFVEPLHKMILNKAKKETVLSYLAGKRLVSDRPGRNIMTFEDDKGKISVQFGTEGFLERVVLQLKKKGAEVYAGLEKEIEERYEKVKLKTGALPIWVHRISTVEFNEVDAYVFVKFIDGAYFLAIGRNWREYGEIDEFLLNISMAQKQFQDIIPNLDIVTVEAVVERDNGKKLLPPAQNNTIEETETPAETSEVPPDVNPKPGDENAGIPDDPPDENVEGIPVSGTRFNQMPDFTEEQ